MHARAADAYAVPNTLFGDDARVGPVGPQAMLGLDGLVRGVDPEETGCFRLLAMSRIVRVGKPCGLELGCYTSG